MQLVDRPGSPTRRTRFTAEQRRAEIVAAAEELLVERGFEGLRVRDVADRVGINNATLHHYFPTKEHLVRGVVEVIVAGLDRVPGADHPRGPRQALRAHLDHVLDQLDTHPERFVVLSELFARASRDPHVREVLREADTGWHDWLAPVLRLGVADGVFRPDLDAEATASVITGLLKSLPTQIHLGVDDRRRAVDQLEALILTDPTPATSPGAGDPA